MLEGKLILVVDDDDRNIFSISAALKPKGPNLLTAINGIECLRVLRNNSEIDLVLLDMMMPEMDGYSTLAEIRKDDVLKNIPVIAITAQAMTGDRERCLESGANDYCSKPVDMDRLMDKIKLLLNL